MSDELQKKDPAVLDRAHAYVDGLQRWWSLGKKIFAIGSAAAGAALVVLGVLTQVVGGVMTAFLFGMAISLLVSMAAGALIATKLRVVWQGAMELAVQAELERYYPLANGIKLVAHGVDYRPGRSVTVTLAAEQDRPYDVLLYAPTGSVEVIEATVNGDSIPVESVQRVTMEPTHTAPRTRLGLVQVTFSLVGVTPTTKTRLVFKYAIACCTSKNPVPIYALKTTEVPL